MAMTFTYDNGSDRLGGGGGAIRTVTAAWTSDGSGNATATTGKIVGTLLQGVTNPDDSAAPTANYDIVLTEENGANLLGGCDFDLTDRHTSNSEISHFLITNAAATDPGGVGAHPAVCSPITITVSNAGDTKSGVLVLYYRTG